MLAAVCCFSIPVQQPPFSPTGYHTTSICLSCVPDEGTLGCFWNLIVDLEVDSWSWPMSCDLLSIKSHFPTSWLLWDLNPLPSVLTPMTWTTALPSSSVLSGCLFLIYPMSSDLLSIKSHFTDILTFVWIEPTTIGFDTDDSSHCTTGSHTCLLHFGDQLFFYQLLRFPLHCWFQQN